MRADDCPVGAILTAIRRDRPTVVLALLHDVELVASLRSVFVGPQHVGAGLKGKPLRVAMAVAEDFGSVAVLAGERIVRRRRAVFLQTQDLAAVAGSVLRPVA